MLIQSLEQKTRLAMITVVTTIIGCAALCGVTFYSAVSMVEKERHQIYVLDGNIPFMAERADLEENFLMEARAHVNTFHNLFFTLSPDDEYIYWTTDKALYLADGSALRQRQSLEESGFYSDIVSASAVCNIMCDSINIDPEKMTFVYYGKQLVSRRSAKQRRVLVTAGQLETVPRSHNNPHGLLIKNWRTVENRTISN